MPFRFFDRDIPDECHQKITSFLNAGDEVVCVAFAPGGGARWSVVAKSGAFFNRNIPDECHQQMGALSQNGAKIVHVAFPPAGGDSFSIVNDHGVFFNRNIPDECHQEMGKLSQGGAKVRWVAFPPQGGNSWSIVNDHGVFFNRGIPDECHQQMGNLSQGGAKILCVAFPPTGGNSWSITNDQGGFFNRGISDEAHMYMGFFSEVAGPIKVVAFDVNGDGWSLVAPVIKAEVICDATRCVTIADVYDNIAARLNGHVVGYACAVGAGSIGAYAFGQARTAADAPAKLFLPSTKIPVASVSKVVTTLAALRILAKHNVGLDTGIGGHLPGDWSLDPHVAAITFRQLLSHRSGIKDYGNNSQDYATLKAFFTQTVDPTKNTPCQGPAVVNPANPINTIDKSGCYSNYNFAIVRVLLPWIDGFVDDPANRAAKLAAAYIRIVQHEVFEPVGAIGVDAKPPTSGEQSNSYAFSYAFPGSSPGHDWGDDSLGVGAAGWYLAIDDIDKVLFSLNNNDGRILTPAQFADMQATPMGWDAQTDATGYRWMEKNGGWGFGATSVSTSIALFGPGVYGALFMNSDYSSVGYQSNWQWCSKCQTLAFAGNAAKGACPAGGQHTTQSNYLVATPGSGLAGQSNWRWCNKCQALSFGGSGTAGPCSAGGQHDHAGSGDYILAQHGSGSLPDGGQDNWRWCHKCQVLSFAGNTDLGPCAGGGKHDHTGSGDYMLTFVVGADTVLHDAYMKALKPK